MCTQSTCSDRRTYFLRYRVNAWILHDNALVSNVLTVLLIRSFKEGVPILVLTQALDSDDESLSSSPPPAIVLSPV